MFPGRRIAVQNESHGQPWISTLPSLQLLRDFGVDPDADWVRHAIAGVRRKCRREHAGQPFFDGEVEPCINGRTVALGVYFGQDMQPLVYRIVGEQLEDGGSGTARRRMAPSVRRLRRRSMCLRVCGHLSRRPEDRLNRLRLGGAAKSTSWKGSCFAAREQEKLWTPPGCNSHFPSAGIMTLCVLLNTFARSADVLIRA